MTQPMTPGSACECVSCEQQLQRYEAWIVTFRNLTSGAMIELTAEDRPAVQVGKRYRLEVATVELP